MWLSDSLMISPLSPRMTEEKVHVVQTNKRHRMNEGDGKAQTSSRLTVVVLVTK